MSEKITNFKELSEELGISRVTLYKRLSQEFKERLRIKKRGKFITAHQVEEIKKELGYL